ncbi:Ku protein [Desulfocurvibacter africanus PCS]|uniref:Non-homologous end joining protein Ku n=1 Tax=Desulfocurvibacter africanus PCS TaxID=1262666 RepID=M5Q006_DESAF|nr:Ku protein [Desulfocurvibacter africanus]EMG36296.1 Ku protein [Desulfocurvibacter africanus PCS]
MPHAVWKGALTFGLLNIPVALYPAERSSDLRFTLLDSRDQARVRYRRVNEDTGREVPWTQIVKAYEYEGGNYVLLTKEDFEKVRVETTRSVEIVAFVSAGDIAPVYFERPYFLEPAEGSEKVYVLLRETLVRTGKAGIAKVVIHEREHLAALLPYGQALLLNLLRFKQELRNQAELRLPGAAAQYKISDRELHMAQTLVEAMAEAWRPEQYHDEYRDKLMAWIEEKAETGAVAPMPEVEEPAAAGKVVDMMDLLRRSVEQTRAKQEAEEAEHARGRRRRAAG